MKVASLHPLMTDLLRQIGGKQIEVVEIGREGFNVHKFEPNAKDIRMMQECKLIVASGKGIELYLSDLKDALSKDQVVVEVGDFVPSQEIDVENSLYACCPTHSAGEPDPHWWHDVDLMGRAAKGLGKAMGVHDAKFAELYKKRASEVQRNLRELDSWVKSEVALVPESNRRLITAHAAFGYFCQAYGFKASYVKGLSAESEISSKDLADTIRQIEKEQIPAVFPEVHGNQKMLMHIAEETNCKVGKALTADGHFADYEKMIRDNVESIVTALK